MRRPAKVLAVLVAVAALVAAIHFLPVARWLTDFQQFVREAGPAGYVIYAAGYGIIGLVFPASVLTLGAGAIFGVVGGTLVVLAGATITATLAFLLARTVLRKRVEAMLARNPKFRAVDAAVAREGSKIVLLVRLAAVFPFLLVNYAFGLTGIRLGPYVAASVVGMIPGTIAFVYLGAAGAALATQNRAKTIVTIAGSVVALAVSVFVARIAARAIERAGIDEP